MDADGLRDKLKGRDGKTVRKKSPLDESSNKSLDMKALKEDNAEVRVEL